jgi:hypothetical protein
MLRQFEIAELHNHAQRYALLALNNESARETSVLTSQRFDELIDVARLHCSFPRPQRCCSHSTAPIITTAATFSGFEAD